MDVGGQLHPALHFTDRWWGGVVVSTLLNAFFIFLKIVLRAGRAALPAQNAMDALSYLVAAARNLAIWARFRPHSPSFGEPLQSTAPLKSAARNDEWLRQNKRDAGARGRPPVIRRELRPLIAIPEGSNERQLYQGRLK